MTFQRITGTRQIRMMINGLRQFFVVVHCADGSVCEYGPFSRGEEASQCIHDIENPTFDDYEEDGITDINALEGATVINNCGELRLANGRLAYWDGVINPESDGEREYMEAVEPWKSVRLPLAY